MPKFRYSLDSGTSWVVVDTALPYFIPSVDTDTVLVEAIGDAVIDYPPPSWLFASGEQGFWYDPSDITTLFRDTAATQPVTAAGQAVARINDKSGRGNHATQATLANRPLYQVDSNGRGHLVFDGADDFLITPSINPGTDKSQIFAGVRKSSDAASGMIAELGTNPSGSNNSSYLLAPSAVGANSYRFVHGGTTVVNAGTGIFAAAPDTAVLSGLGNITGPSAQLRRNGTVVETITTTQGTGTLQTSVVYIGSRTGTVVRFNGRIYGLVMRFGPVLTTPQVETVEAWMNIKTGAY